MAFLEENCVLDVLTDGILSECRPFTCGDDDMDEFFQKDALAYTRYRMGKSYCFRMKDDAETIVACFTVSNDSIRIYDLPSSRRNAMWKITNREKMLTGRTAYLNDRDGNRIERTVFLGNQMTKKESSRFQNGLKVEEQSFDANGEMTERRTYKYDQQGNCIEMEFYNRDGELMQHYLYKYDARGNRIEWRFYDADEFLSALTTYYYDDHDNLIEVSSFNYDEHLNWKHSYVYEYDEDDNWVRQTIYRNNVPYQVIEREIAFPAN